MQVKRFTSTKEPERAQDLVATHNESEEALTSQDEGVAERLTPMVIKRASTTVPASASRPSTTRHLPGIV